MSWISMVINRFRVTKWGKGRKFRDRRSNRMSKDALALLIEHSPDAIFSRDMDRKILSWNRGAEQIFGYSAMEAIGQTALQLGFANLTEEAIAAIEREIITTGVWKSERYYRRKNGEAFFGAVTANTIRDRQGQVSYLVFIIRDISARKELEETLIALNGQLEAKVRERTHEIARNETMLRALLEHSEEGVSVTSKDFKPLIRSLSFYHLLGDIDIGDLDAFAHPDDVGQLYVARKKALENPGITIAFQGRFRDPAGSYNWLEGSLTNLFHVPGLEAMVANFRNITLRKQAEEALQKSEEHYRSLVEQMVRLIDALPATIALLDPAGRIIEVNAAWRNFARDNGAPGDDNFIGHNYLDVCDRADGGSHGDGLMVGEGIRRVLDGKEERFLYEYTCDGPGIKRWFRMIVTPLSLMSREGVVVMHLNVTELRRLELEKMQRQLNEEKAIAAAMAEAQERERNFIGAELHDNINQLMVGTLMTLSLAKRNPAASEEHILTAMKYIRETIEAARNIAHLLVAPDFSEISLTVLLEALTAEMLIKGKIEVKWELMGFEEGRLQSGHRLTIYRICQEQFTNILKYAHASTVQITLEMSDSHFLMSIVDDGLGIDMNKTTAGIGMRNIRGRLLPLGGLLRIETEKGAGFSLHIGFPLQKS